jgi:hypothetical protein
MLLGSSSEDLLQIGVDLAGDVALETAHDLPFGEAFLQAAVDVGAGGGVWARIRVQAIFHRALLAWRSPPRCSRWRFCAFPEVAGVGAAPHSRAKVASLANPAHLSANGPPGQPVPVTITALAIGSPLPG